MNITQNGKTEYKILLAENVRPAELHAAHLLQKYVQDATLARMQIWRDTALRKISGKDNYTPLPARGWRDDWNDKLYPAKFISIGNNKLYKAQNFKDDFNALNGDGFYLRTKGDHLFISAKCDRGVLYGVCEVLERFLGIRFLTARETYVPRTDVFTVPALDEKCVPAFAMRTYLSGDVFQDFADPEFYVCSRTDDSFTQMDAAHGGRAPMWGRNVDHNYHFYVPEDVYGKTHPEFYYHDKTYGPTIDLLNGITADGKLDESKEISVAKVVIEEMKKDVIANPDIDFFVFEQEDGPFFYPYTKPEDLAVEKKYGRTGIMIRFCNVLARELQNWADCELDGRKINIVTFAYSYTTEAPVKKKNGKYVPIDDTVVACDNLVIRMAIMSNAYYDYFDNRQEDYVTDALSQWGVCAKNFMFWAYDNNFTRYLYYFPSFHTIAANVRGFYKMGISYLSMQGPHNSCVNWQGDLRGYVYRKLMWDPSRDADALIEEFVTLYYGMAAPYVRSLMRIFDEWYASVDKERKVDARMVVGNHFMPEYNSIEVIDRAEAEIIKAEQAVAASALSDEEKELLRKKLLRVKVTPQFMRYNDYLAYYPDRTETDREVFGKEFFENCAHADIEFFAETMMFEEYTLEKKL